MAFLTFEGNPCPKGHTERYVATRRCVTCGRDNQARSRRGETNPKDGRAPLKVNYLARAFAVTPRVTE